MEMKDHNICNQYYKDILTGVEMNFIFRLPYGWIVSFPNVEAKETLYNLPSVDYPKTPEKYKDQIDQFYKDLKKRYKGK